MPRELRDLIYEHLFTGLVFRIRHDKLPGILTANRRLREEATKPFHKFATMRFNWRKRPVSWSSVILPGLKDEYAALWSSVELFTLYTSFLHIHEAIFRTQLEVRINNCLREGIFRLVNDDEEWARLEGARCTPRQIRRF